MGNKSLFLESIEEANRIQQEAADGVDPDAPSSLYACYDDNSEQDNVLYFKYQQLCAQLEEGDDLAQNLVNQAIMEVQQ